MKIVRKLGDTYPIYKGQGTIKNLTQNTFDRYSLDVISVLFNSNNESFTLNDDVGTINMDDGFGGGFLSFKNKKPWKPKEEIKFDIEDYLSEQNMLYPIAKAQVVLRIRASDPFGAKVEDVLAQYDITEQWLTTQKKLAK